MKIQVRLIKKYAADNKISPQAVRQSEIHSSKIKTLELFVKIDGEVIPTGETKQFIVEK